MELRNTLVEKRVFFYGVETGKRGICVMKVSFYVGKWMVGANRVLCMDVAW